MPWRRRVPLVVSLLLIVISTLIWWTANTRPAAPISLSFLGFTNQPLTLRTAGGSRLMHVSPTVIAIPSAQVRVRNESASQVLLLPHAGFHSLIRVRPGFSPASVNGFPKVLKPGEEWIVQAYPKGNGPWWTGVACQRHGRLERLHARLLTSGNTKALALLNRVYTPPSSVFVSSDVLTNCPPTRVQEWPVISRFYPAPSLRDGGFYE